MAMTLYATNIYSNDGSTLLWSGSFENTATCTVNSGGVHIARSDQFVGDYGYGGGGTFKGIATSANASTATYAVGDTFYTASSTLNLYIVDEGGGGGGGGTVTIKYNGSTIYTGTAKKTLQCSGKVMAGNVEVSVS